MSRMATLLGTALVVTVMAAGSALARGAGGRSHSRPSGDRGPVSVVTDPQDPIDWLTDYDKACKLASDENRALLILITTEQAERVGGSCSFAPNWLRKAVRESQVVPLKLLPPVMLDTARVPPDEAKKRQEVFKQARERYEALAKGFGVSAVPSLVYSAPDAAKLMLQAAPADQDIAAMLARLPEMIKAHKEALAKAGSEPPKAAEAGPKEETKPPEPAKPPKTGKPDVDDF